MVEKIIKKRMGKLYGKEMTKEHKKFLDDVVEDIKNKLIVKAKKHGYTFLIAGIKGLVWDLTRKYHRIILKAGEDGEMFKMKYFDEEYLKEIDEEVYDILGYSILFRLYIKLVKEKEILGENI